MIVHTGSTVEIMIAMIIARAFLFPNGSVITSVAILLYCNRNHMKSTVHITESLHYEFVAQKKKSSLYELVVQGYPEKGRSERPASPHKSSMERFNNTWGSCRHGSPAKVHGDSWSKQTQTICSVSSFNVYMRVAKQYMDAWMSRDE